MANDIIITNEKALEKLKYKILEDGPNKLHILADFDRTLTKNFVDGEEVPSIISVLCDGTYLTSDYAPKAHALFEKYHPIEINPKISLKEKKKAMREWWETHFKLLIQCGLNKKNLEKVVNSSKLRFRKGVLEFVDMLHKYDIPLVIMSSSGLGGDAISMYLEKQGRLYNNIYIISNSYKWDKNGNAIAIKEPIIHSMNKDETMIQDFPDIYKIVKNRKNIILLGDSVEDTGMIIGFDYENIIKIGFLNKNIEENLERYRKNFDITILNDSDKFYADELLKELIK